MKILRAFFAFFIGETCEINPGSLSGKNKGKNKLFKFYEEIVYCY